MTLTLSIANVDRLENGEPTSLKLDRHGVTIGRSTHVDWSLPDPNHYISSTHCEVRYKDGAYTLVDISTNGTFVNGGSSRVSNPHTIADGDVILIGHYELRAKLQGGSGAAAAPASSAGTDKPFTWGVESAPAPAPRGPSGWETPEPALSGGWNAPAATSAPAGPSAGWAAPAPSAGSPDGWGPAARPVASGGSSWADVAPAAPPERQGGLGDHWAPPRIEPAASTWEQAPAPVQQASAWSAPISDTPREKAAGDIWSSMADLNNVDWDRGGFDRAAPKPASDPFGLSAAQPSPTPSWQSAPQPAAAAAGPSADGRAWPSAAAPQPTMAPRAQPSTGGSGPAGAGLAPAKPPVASAAATPAGAPSAGWSEFLAAAGLEPAQVKGPPAQAMASAGAALRKLIGGMVVLLEARARAKSQMGAAGTSLEFDGNNPLKFARSPEKALGQLLSPPERGFMPTERAIEDAFQDLQAHQMATLAAMQGALAATLKRFSPSAIRERAQMRGILAKIVPSARDATLWQAYEREFEGVAKGSDEAFMDVFAKEFRQAYEATSAQMKQKRG